MASTNSNRTLRLIVIDSDARSRESIKHSLTENGSRLIGEADDIKSGLRLIRGLQPDLIVLELPANATETMEAVKKIREELPDMGIILSAHKPSPQLILSCIRSGAQEFVNRPIDVSELDRAIEHVRKLMERTISSGRRKGTVLSVFSPKGGIGATSVTANLACALAERPNTKTVVVDLSFQLGDLGLMFDHPPNCSLTEALEDGTIEESKLRTILAKHSSGVQLLTVAASPEVGEEISRNHMAELFGTLSTIFDYVVVDVGRFLDDRTIEVLEFSDGILMLVMLDLPTIRNASRYMDIFTQLDIDRDHVHLIVNRFHKKTRLTLMDLETNLGMETFWTLPNDFQPISLGIDAGRPVVIEAPKSKAAQSFKDLAEVICEKFEDEYAAAPETVEATTTTT